MPEKLGQKENTEKMDLRAQLDQQEILVDQVVKDL